MNKITKVLLACFMFFSVVGMNIVKAEELSKAQEVVLEIDELPGSLLESDDVEATILDIQAVNAKYEALTEEEKLEVTNYDKLANLLNANSTDLDLENIASVSGSVLEGKTIGYLGSSITVGFASDGIAFGDYIAKMTNSNAVIEGKAGGTLALKEGVREEVSYITKLWEDKLTNTEHLDAFVVQLSTNDTTLGIEIGELSDSTNIDDFDYSTVYGAMEYIIAYAKEKWDCPVLFYINAYLSDDAVTSFCEANGYNEADIKYAYQDVYEQMIEALYNVQKKWGIGIIDMWNDEPFHSTPTSIREYYMNDPIHPKKAGYLFWYAPFMQETLEEFLTQKPEINLIKNDNVYSYNAAADGYASKFSNLFTPAYYVFAGAVTESQAEDLVNELGIVSNLQEWGTAINVVTPLNGKNYTQEDVENFINLMGPALTNVKVIGVDEGATFVNNYISQKCYAVAGIFTYGGEMDEGLSNGGIVPAYLSNPSETAINYYVKANEATEVSTDVYQNSTDPLQQVVVGHEADLATAFNNAWEKVLSRNYRQHNETTEFYMSHPAVQTDPYLLINIPNYEELGMNYIEHYSEPIEGAEGAYTWFEYVPDSVLNMKAEGTVPLVVSLHGNGNDPRIQGDSTGWVELAAQENFIVVAPEWQDVVVDSEAHTEGPNFFNCDGVEVCFDQFMEMLFKTYPQIDKTRVYVTGLSAGASASALYGVKYQNYFAAAGAVSGPGLDCAALSELVEDATEQTAFMYICGDHDFFGMIPVDGSSKYSFQVAPGVYLQDVDPNTKMFSFIQSYQKLNGLEVSENYDMSLNPYYGVELENEQWITLGVKDTLEGTLSNDTGVVVKLAAIKDQAHWNYKPEAQYMWEFFSHYSRENGILYIDGVATDTLPENFAEMMAEVGGSYVYRDYTLETKADGVYHIHDTGTSNPSSMYLIVDGKDALLIDGSNGTTPETFDDIVQALVEDRNLEIALTHNHGDHVGMFAAGLYEGKTVYCPTKDYNEDTKVVLENYKVKLVDDGEMIKVGKTKLTVQNLYGHTEGSVVFVDKDHEIVYSGDEIGSGFVWLLFVDDALSLYDEGLNRLIETTKDMKNLMILPGHAWQQTLDNQAGIAGPGEVLGKAYLQAQLKVLNAIADGTAILNDYTSVCPWYDDAVEADVEGVHAAIDTRLSLIEQYQKATEEQPKTPEKPEVNTADNTPIILFAGLSILSAAAFIELKRRQAK